MNNPKPVSVTETDVDDEGVMLALVMDNTPKEGQIIKHVLLGQDGILLHLPKNEEGETDTSKLFSFNELASLLLHDEDNNGYIDARDDIYDEIYIAHLDDARKILTFRSIREVGVVAIIFNQEFIVAEGQGEPKRFDKVAGDIVMADSSRWNLRVVPLPISHFKNLQLTEHKN